MPFSREAALARKNPAAYLTSEPGNIEGCMHVTVDRTYWDGQVIEKCRECGARVDYWESDDSEPDYFLNQGIYVEEE